MDEGRENVEGSSIPGDLDLCGVPKDILGRSRYQVHFHISSAIALASEAAELPRLSHMPELGSKCTIVCTCVEQHIAMEQVFGATLQNHTIVY